MKIHEYQAKALLREFGVAVPKGEVADTPAQARAIAERLGGRVVVKAQVHAGGRGKAGGIKVADDPQRAEQAAGQILGMMLKTPQTPPEGIRVRKVLVEEASAIERELYLSITLDRARATNVVMASQAGGMEIEEVAVKTPDKILREWAHPARRSSRRGHHRGGEEARSHAARRVARRRDQRRAGQENARRLRPGPHDGRRHGRRREKSRRTRQAGRPQIKPRLL